MSYEKQGFVSGNKLYAAQLVAMEEGILENEANISAAIETMAVTAANATNAMNEANNASAAAAELSDSMDTLSSELAEWVDKIKSLYQLTIINVASKLGTGTEDSPISLADLEISDGNVLYFNNNTFYLDPATIEGVQDLTVLANEATLTGTTEQTEALLHFRDCDNLYFNGGLITGENVNIGLQVTASQNVHVENTRFYDISSTDFESGCAIFLLGDCSGFNVESCYIDGITGGVISSDGFIHAYGIFVNRRGSDLTYSSSGSISNCVITNVAGTDMDDTKADGDGIFIQVPPYLDDDSELVRPMAYIKVNDCYITDCKKRGIKLSCCGATVENCYIVGEFWYAAIDCQYGYATIRHCYISDTSSYTSTSISNIMLADGNDTITDCTIGGLYYYEEDDGTQTLTARPGIRCGDRLSGSVIDSAEPWGPITIERNTFDHVRRCFYAYSSSNDNEYTLEKFVFRDNIIVWDKAERWVEISSTVFGTIEAFEMIDWLCTFGNSRSEVKETWSSFVYPVSLGCTFTEAFYLYSKNWEDEPMSGYSGLPTGVHHSKIVYSGSNMGQITWHEWHAESPSMTMGTRAPDSLTSTLSKQLLYNSKVGDVYTDSSTGDIYYCTEAGTSSSIGTWTQGGSEGTASEYDKTGEVDVTGLPVNGWYESSQSDYTLFSSSTSYAELIAMWDGKFLGSSSASVDVSFTVTVTGTDLSYQWQYSSDDGSTWYDVSDKTLSNWYNSSSDAGCTLTITATASMSGYLYRCIVTDGDGNTATSGEAALTLIDAGSSDLYISAHPADNYDIKYSGVTTTTTFYVVAVGTDLTYQWQYKSSSGASWTDCSSATTGYNTDTLNVQFATSRNGYAYRCVVTDGDGNSVTSNAAYLYCISSDDYNDECYINISPASVTAELAVSEDETSGAVNVYRNDLGAGSDGQSLYEYVFKPLSYSLSAIEKTQPKVLILAGIQGQEKCNIFGLYYFACDLMDNSLTDPIMEYLRYHAEIHVLPVACPWSFDNDKYVNYNGVSLNRNFDTSAWANDGTLEAGDSDYPGESAASEPETQIIQDWIASNGDAMLYVDFHTNGQYCVSSYEKVNWICPCVSDDDYYNKLLYIANYHLGNITPHFISEFGLDTTELLGYISRSSSSSTSKLYAYENGVMGVTFEGFNGFPDESSRYSANAQKANAELIGNFAIASLNECSRSDSAGSTSSSDSDTGDTYTLTDEDKNDIAEIVLTLVTDGDEVSY